MQLYGIMPHVVGLLQWAGRLSSPMLQLQCGLDAAQVEAVRAGHAGGG